MTDKSGSGSDLSMAERPQADQGELPERRYADCGSDNIYELTSEVMKDSGGTTIYSITWTYDNVGNRATQTKDGNQTSYTYNNMNQMTAAGNITFTYDSNGNTASKTESSATTNYTWNYENALSKIDNPSGDDYVYEYDGDGMRVRAGHDSGQGSVWDSRFYYDIGASLYAYLFESDNDHNVTAAYTVDRRSNLICQRRSGATSYHLYDQLGSTRQLLNSNQTTTDSYSYYAFGEVRSSSGSTANPFKFVGRLGYYDDPSTEFQYLRARYYAAPYGRFWSGERQRGGGPGYGYTGGNPNAFVDPSGQWKICLPHPTSVHEERNVHPTTDWSTWECHDADCDYSVLEHPVETIVCTWKKSRSIEGEERWCRWWRCWEKVRGKKCRTWFEYRCSPWEAFKGTENKYDTTYIEIGSCRTMDRKEMKKECTTHTWPGG